EVMVRGTFANVRLKNRLAPGTEGAWTTRLPSGKVMRIFAASEKYRAANIPLVVLAGKEYGTGSSRDWAAKGPALLGVRAVIAESYERIHRSNLVGMGILPLQFAPGQSAESLGLKGDEVFSIAAVQPGQEEIDVVAIRPDDSSLTFTTRVRIDTPNEYSYYRNGGILHYVLRRLAAGSGPTTSKRTRQHQVRRRRSSRSARCSSARTRSTGAAKAPGLTRQLAFSTPWHRPSIPQLASTRVSQWPHSWNRAVPVPWVSTR